MKVIAPTKSQLHVFDKIKHERAATGLKTDTFHLLNGNHITKPTGPERKFEDHSLLEQKMEKDLVHVRF